MYLKTKRVHRWFVVLASGRDIAHKAFESPAYAEPCIVPIAKGIFGGYISQNAVKKIADDFYLVTAFFKLVNVPPSVYVPYTKTNIAKGAVPNCIVDHWVFYMMESLTCTDAVVKELLRLRPPVIFVSTVVWVHG
ncbi:cytochrome P450 61 [Colletotrichum higginsianum]|uniref:Cytochrome P450 61 n=1 Tax=Colletotrichum higginsianum (strain IMI 349063) TaxID=759273 RepID=H1VT76_COLHI|nr:cytochrome P450 61 [Colletotrichum higginsianum]